MDISVSRRMDREKTEIFCCYAHKDQRWFFKLRAHLASLEREGLITLWADTDISAGEEWQKEIRRHLEMAQIILLLVSPNFIASEYCYSVEMLGAMKRHEQGEARVIPIILRHFAWQDEPFGKLKVLPTSTRPIISSSWHSQDQAFDMIVEEIRRVVEPSEIRNPIDEASWSIEQVPGRGGLGRLQPQRPSYYLLYRLGVFFMLLCLFSILVLPRLPFFTPWPDTTSISTPTGLITPGILTVGSDTTYPPMEFIDRAGQPDGFDIDLAYAIARKMGLKQVNVEPANFATIMDDLKAKHYDIVISSQMITDERERQVDFVPYFYSGLSLLVQKGNPQDIQSLTDLCGQAVGVEDGTIELDLLKATDKECEVAGKPIKIMDENTQTDVFQLLVKQSVIAIFQDAPVTDYYSKTYPELFEGAGHVIDPNVEGISVRKGDTSMFNAVQESLNDILADGTYYTFLEKWHLSPLMAI